MRGYGSGIPPSPAQPITGLRVLHARLGVRAGNRLDVVSLQPWLTVDVEQPRTDVDVEQPRLDVRT